MFSRAYKMESNQACNVALSGDYFALGTAVLTPHVFMCADTYIGRKIPEQEAGIPDYEKVIRKVDETLAREKALLPSHLLAHVPEWADPSEPPRANHIAIVKLCFLRRHIDDPRDHIFDAPSERGELAASWVITQPGIEPIAYISPEREKIDAEVDIWPQHAGPETESVALEVVESWREGQTYPVIIAISGLEKVIHFGAEREAPRSRLEA